jgi:hypothetical protein
MLLKLEPGVLSAVLVSSGAAKLALALAGIVFAVRALTWRRRDGATGLARPLAGMAFSFLHALVAISMCLMPLAMSGGTGTHRVAFPEHGFAMELPGDSWTRHNVEGAEAFLVHRMPHVRASVHVRPGGQAEYEESVKQFDDALKAPEAGVVGEPRSRRWQSDGGRQITACEACSKSAEGETLRTCFVHVHS